SAGRDAFRRGRHRPRTKRTTAALIPRRRIGTNPTSMLDNALPLAGGSAPVFGTTRMEVRNEERLSAGCRGGFGAVDSPSGGRRLGGAVHDDVSEPGVKHEPVRVVPSLCG